MSAHVTVVVAVLIGPISQYVSQAGMSISALLNTRCIRVEEYVSLKEIVVSHGVVEFLHHELSHLHIKLVQSTRDAL